MESFIRSLPKTETHLHVEGALPYELLHAWRPDQYPAHPPFRERSYRYATFPDFENILLDNALPWFTDAQQYHEACKVLFAGHVAHNVHYVETSFHLPVTGFINVPGPEIIDAIRTAAPEGLEVRVFAGMLRSDLNDVLRPTIDELHTWEHLAGIDLHGYELMKTEPGTAGVWSRLREAGKITKCHAGEFDGPQRVREAIEELGVTRIQHGTHAIEDPEVVALAADHGVTFDMCPLSNVGLQVVPSMTAHPIRQFMEAGINCTVSTDDPLCFANTITEEYLALANELNFTREELAQVAKNGWKVADVSAEMRREQIAAIDAALSA